MHPTTSRLLLALALALAAPGPAAAQPQPAPGSDLVIAGKLPLEDTLVVERVAADGKTTEMFRGGAPTSWRWLDARTLLELFDEHGTGDTVIARIVDGRPDPQHAIKVDNTEWPQEAQGWSQYLAVHQGQLWLVRAPAASPAPAKAKPKARGKAKAPPPPPPGKPVYLRVDVMPHVPQREPPAGGVAARNDGRAWLESLPQVPAPKTLAVTRTKARIGNKNLNTVRCKPAKGAVTAFPTRTTYPLLRLDVDAIRFVSPTLPLYIAGGMVDLPDGKRFATAAFLGCTAEPLHTVAWGGKDVFLTIAGLPGGAGFSAGDKRKMQLWMDGHTVADLGVLLDPALPPRTP
ncbi:MAG TPA: hypothetical protein VF469_31090 [Kofleriaceae bacterium]